MSVDFVRDGHEWVSPDGRRFPVMAGADDVEPTAGDPVGDALEDFATDPDSHPDAPAKEPAEPPAKAEPAEPTKPAADRGPAPWETDLAERGLDDPAYLDYHRETVQPYITQLEQSRAQFADLFAPFGKGDDAVQAATIGANILTALEEDPLGTVRDLMEDLGIDPTQLGFPAGAAADESDLDADPDAEPTDPDRQFLQELRAEREQQQQERAYNDLISELKEEIPDFDETRFHVAMRAADGDPNEAWEIYQELTGAAAPAEPAAPAKVPPPAMGAAVGNTATPSTKTPRTLSEAFDDFFAEDRAASAKR